LLHEPIDVESVWPCVVVPEIAGSVVFAGGRPETTAVGLEVALAEPAELLAVTTKRMVEPASGRARVRELEVAPEMSKQLAPKLLQRRH
jgi:hypothetical protein